MKVPPEQVLGWDLSLFACEASSHRWPRRQFLFAPRIDNLAGCHGALWALLKSQGPRPHTRGIVLFDHEEVGGQSARGAGLAVRSFLLPRVLEAHGPFSETRLARAISRSYLVSSDMAQASTKLRRPLRLRPPPVWLGRAP